ncbi:2345_t:CDS:10, partial [Gigaspora rosea]
MDNQVLCTCIWCLQELNYQSKLVNKSTRAKHSLKQKNTWPNPAQIPAQERRLVTSISQISSTIALTSSAVSVVTLSEILEREKDYGVCNMDDNEYNNEYNEEYNSKYNEKDDGEYNDEYNNEYNENSEKENEKYNEKYDNNGYDDKEYNEEDNEEYSDECSEEFDIENLSKGLRLFRIKNQYNISDIAFNEILKILEISEITLYKLQRLLGNLVPFKPTLIDCCINSCVAFTNEFINMKYYSECNEPRYKFGKASGESRKNATYWPLHTYTTTHDYEIGGQIANIFDNDCWVILFMNANLPPDVRVQCENLMISALILGPKAPKNFNTFLRPLVDELKQLQVCSIHGVYCKENSHIYFPLKPPNGVLGYQYDPKNLLLWIYENYLLNIAAIECLNRSSRKRESIKFPDSFPVDIMHSLFENIAPAMLQHWSADINKKLFETSSEKLSYHSENRIFVIKDVEEKLYSVALNYYMNKTKMQRLKAYYLFTNTVQKYGKLQTRQGIIINSRQSNRKSDIAHRNFCIAAKLLVDHNANYRNTPVILEMQGFFGEFSKHGPLKFCEFGSLEVINVSVINRNVGFLKMLDNEMYIINKENQ